MAEFGELLGGAGDKAEGLVSQWSNWLAQPSNKAMLAGFATRALQGSYGSPVQAFGEAMGVGLEAAGVVEKQEADLAEKVADRASLDRRAKMAADTRGEVAAAQADAKLQAAHVIAASGEERMRMRVEGMLARSKLVHGPKTMDEMKKEQADMKFYAERFEKSLSGIGAKPEEIIEKAGEYARAMRTLRRAEQGTVEEAPGTAPPPAPSAAPPRPPAARPAPSGGPTGIPRGAEPEPKKPAKIQGPISPPIPIPRREPIQQIGPPLSADQEAKIQAAREHSDSVVRNTTERILRMPGGKQLLLDVFAGRRSIHDILRD